MNRLLLPDVVIVLSANNIFAQLPVAPLANQEALLQSNDPKLAANKKLVYDCWRELLEASHLELTDKYLAGQIDLNYLNTHDEKSGCVYFQPRKITPDSKYYKEVYNRMMQYSNVN